MKNVNISIQFPTRTSPNDSDSRPCILYGEYQRKNTNDEIRVNRAGLGTWYYLCSRITWKLLYDHDRLVTSLTDSYMNLLQMGPKFSNDSYEHFGPIWTAIGLDWKYSWHRMGLSWINVTNIFTLSLILFRINQKADLSEKYHLGVRPVPSLTAVLYGTLVIINRRRPYHFQSKLLGKLLRLLGKMTYRKLTVGCNQGLKCLLILYRNMGRIGNAWESQDLRYYIIVFDLKYSFCNSNKWFIG